MLWDPWCNGKLISEFGILLRGYHLSVKEFIHNGQWRLPSIWPVYVREAVLSINIVEQSILTWDGSSNPAFKNFIASFFFGLEEVNWVKFIWHKYYSLRFSCYAWMALIGKLKCADLLIGRGLQFNTLRRISSFIWLAALSTVFGGKGITIDSPMLGVFWVLDYDETGPHLSIEIPFSLWKVFWQPWNFAEWTCALLLEPYDDPRALPFILFLALWQPVDPLLGCSSSEY
ncbi:hypothetical protein M5K25_023404 [Dendrobium thyrsiflorum]|uniref:Reverse transcriptase zinc-binding domain-containing protein n=1 Tax=Dendrobium thyrsiflorum TaxID=117978 RepID=A0ABD0UF06_DENTH